jgi:hypothetical protein
MGKIAKRTMLLRRHIELPDNLKLATEEFRKAGTLSGQEVLACWIERSGGADGISSELVKDP